MTISALSMPFCCRRRCARVLAFGFFFLDTLAFDCAVRAEKLEVSGRGREVSDLSRSTDGDTARLAARECIDFAMQELE